MNCDKNNHMVPRKIFYEYDFIFQFKWSLLQQLAFPGMGINIYVCDMTLIGFGLLIKSKSPHYL